MEKYPKSILFELCDKYHDKMSKPQIEFIHENNNSYWCTINITIDSKLISIVSSIN